MTEITNFLQVKYVGNPVLLDQMVVKLLGRYVCSHHQLGFQNPLFVVGHFFDTERVFFGKKYLIFPRFSCCFDKKNDLQEFPNFEVLSLLAFGCAIAYFKHPESARTFQFNDDDEALIWITKKIGVV